MNLNLFARGSLPAKNRGIFVTLHLLSHPTPKQSTILMHLPSKYFSNEEFLKLVPNNPRTKGEWSMNMESHGRQFGIPRVHLVMHLIHIMKKKKR